jgi:hypothetical protein
MRIGQRNSGSYLQAAERRLDAVIGGRLFNVCWLISSIGISMVQLRLLALAWQQGEPGEQALTAALVAAAWLGGSLLASVLPGGRRQALPRLWGGSLLLCALLELALPLRRSAAIAPWAAVGELALMASFSGLLASAWLQQRRPWPPADERAALARGALSTLLALTAIWLWPTWSALLELACLGPLFLLDCWPAARAPLPSPGRMIDSWFDTTEGAGRWRLQLNASWLLRGGWWFYLARRGQLPLILLASGLSISLGSVWTAVPTPFAGMLRQQGQSGILLWLLLAQIAALLLALGLLISWRGVLGPADRLIPERWRPACWTLALCLPFAMAITLLALGLPFLQAPAWLALSLGLYTLAATLWGMLLPRLRPSLSTLIFSQRHLIQAPGTQLDQSHLAYERAQEEYVNRFLFSAEGLLTMLLAPLLGWLIDRWGVDGVLVAAGRCLLLFLVLSVAVLGFQREIRYRRVETMQRSLQHMPWDRLQRGAQPREATTEPLEPAGSTGSNGNRALLEEIRLFLQQNHDE